MTLQPQASAMISAVRRVRPKSLAIIWVIPSVLARSPPARPALTVGGKRTVGLALNTSLGVPLRFTVANKVYL
jgi:hypothetical protein